MQKIRHQHEIVTLAPGYLKGTAHDGVVSTLHPGGGRVLPRNRNHCAPIEACYVALRKASTESDAKETVACGDIEHLLRCRIAGMFRHHLRIGRHEGSHGACEAYP